MGGEVVDESVMEDNEKFVRQLEEGELKEHHDAIVEHMKEFVAEAGISIEVRIRTTLLFLTSRSEILCVCARLV